MCILHIVPVCIVPTVFVCDCSVMCILHIVPVCIVPTVFVGDCSVMCILHIVPAALPVDTDTVEHAWTVFRDAVFSAAETALGFCKRKH